MEERSSSGWVVARDLGSRLYIVHHSWRLFKRAKDDEIGQNPDAEGYGRRGGYVDIQVTEAYGEADLTVY